MIATLLMLIPIGSFGNADAAPVFPKQIREAALLSTIRVICTDSGNSGSGVAIGMKDNWCYALTAQHVVAKSQKITIFASVDEKEKKFNDAEVVGALAEESDLALLRFATGEKKVVCLALSEKLPELKNFPSPVLNCGWQLDSGPTCGEDEALGRKLLVRNQRVKNAFFWQTKGTSEEGRSGGPLIAKSGALIGICSGNQDGKGYFAHRDEIASFLKKQASSPWLLDKNRK